MRSTSGGAARVVLVLGMAVVAAALLVPAAAAAGPVWYRVGAGAGVASYDQLAGSPSLEVYSTAAQHGTQTGTFRFHPGDTVGEPGSGPGQSASGVGYATPSRLSGTVPAGTWRFGVDVQTTIRADTATGRIVVAVYKVGRGGPQLVAFVQDARNVLAASSSRFELTASLPALAFDDDHLATEWYLAISSNGAPAGPWTTTLRHGASGDHVTAPGALAPPPLAAPTNLRVTATGDNTIGLAWIAAVDRRVSDYVVRRATSADGPWVDVTTEAGTTHTDGELRNGTPYYYTVVARDAAGTRSSPSNATSAVPADTTAPTAPGAPAVAPNGSGRLDLGWARSPSGDVTGYEVQRSGSSAGPFAAVARVAATTFSDTGLAAASIWHYRIVAIDDDGLRSAPTAPAAGTVAPSPPTELRVVGVASGAVALAWNGTTEPVTGYLVERAGTSGGPYQQITVRPVGETSFTDSGLTNGARYWFRIRAVDASGARSSPSGAVSAVPADTGRPAPPTYLVKQQLGNRVQLAWGPSPSAVVGYRILRTTTPGSGYTDMSGLTGRTSFIDGPLPVAIPFYYVVVAEDAAGNLSIKSTQERYTVQPSAPTGLVATEVNKTSARLRWNGTGEPLAGWVLSRRVAGGRYVAVGRANEPAFVDGGSKLGHTYQYVVQAEAIDGTLSPPSNEVTVVPRDGPPTSPTRVQVTDTGAGGQLRIMWAANPERDVTAYRVEHRQGGGGWTRVATLGTITYLDRGLTDGASYTYRVMAVDRVGNVSAPSAEESGVPTDRSAPPPSGVVVRAWPSSLDVAWSQAPGATAYRMYRSTSPTGPFTPVTGVITSRVYRDANVTRGTRYFYVVHVFDAAGNDSGPSQAVSATLSGFAGGPPGGGTGADDGTGGTGRTGGIGGASGTDPTAGSGGPTAGAGLGYPDLSQAGGARPGAATRQRLSGEAGRPVPSATPGGAPPLAIGDIPLAADQPGLPPRTRADELLATGDVPRAITRSAEEVAQNVTEVVRVFRGPLLLLFLLLAYAIAQGRLGRETLPAATDVETGGVDDDAEYIL